MTFVNRVLHTFEDWLIGTWASSSVWIALVLASAIMSLLLIGVFQLGANPAGIRAARNRFIARTLELLLFRHDGRVLLTACGRILSANVHYLGQFLRPVLIGALPMTLLATHGLAWFEHRPFQPGEQFVVELKLDDRYAVSDTPVEILRAAGLSHLVGPVVIPSSHEICFRFTAEDATEGELVLRVGSVEYQQPIPIGGRMVRVSPTIRPSGWFTQLLYPADQPLPAEGPIVNWQVHYPTRQLWIGNWEFSAPTIGVAMTLAFTVLGAWACGTSLV